MLKALVSLQSRVSALRDEDGNAAEYGLIIAGVAVVIIAGLVILGPAIRDLFISVGNQL